MIQDIAADLALEKQITSSFAADITIQQMIARGLPLSRVAEAEVFLTSRHQLYVFIQAEGAITTGDVRKMVRHMGCEIDDFIGPRGDSQYFTRIATEKFRTVFPGRMPLSEDDLRYYYTLIPYNPALVRVKTVTHNVLYQFDPESESSWRPVIKLVYRSVKAK